MSEASLGMQIPNLQGVSAVADGPALWLGTIAGSQIIVRTTGVPVDMSIAVQGSNTGGTSPEEWYPIFDSALTAEGNNYLLIDEPHKYVRTSVTAHNDGTVSTWVLPFFGAR